MGLVSGSLFVSGILSVDLQVAKPKQPAVKKKQDQQSISTVWNQYILLGSIYT